MNRWAKVLMCVAALFSPIFVCSAEEALVLSIATESHPHVRSLQDGRVPVQGCQIQYSTHPQAALMGDLAGEKKFDVVEVELLPFLEKKSIGELKDYTLIPVFLTREFQMRKMFIRSDRGILSAADLRGKTVGLAGARGSTSVWLRGILQSSWTVKPEEIHWVDVEESTAIVQSLSSGLAEGKLDAAFTGDLTPEFLEKHKDVVRLFDDYRQAEYDTFQITRVFPIMTALAIREKLVDENPWLPEALFLAFSEAKSKAMADMTLPLPWGGAKLDETEKLMGKNFWSYGIKSNPKSLGALFRYAREQKLLPDALNVEDVFTPSTLMLLEN